MTSGSTRDLADLSAGALRRLKRLARTARAGAEGIASRFDRSPPAPLFIHFGAHKTGSSSIQDTLYQNNGRTFGYDYPDLGMANGSLALGTAFSDEASMVARRLLPSLEIARQRKEADRARLAALLAAAPRKLPKVLSGEGIAHFKPEELAALDQFVSQYWPDRIYLGYVREPVSFLRSAYQETLKRANPAAHLIDPAAPLSALTAPGHALVDRLDALVGRERVRVFAFDAEGFPGGDVVRHFLRQIGAREEGIALQRTNEGLTLLAVKLLYLYRTRTAPHDLDVGSPRTRKGFVQAIADLGAARFELHPEVVARIVQANQPFYDWSERRLDLPIRPPVLRHEDGVAGPADLERLSPGEVTLFHDLLRGYGLGLPAHPDGDALAQGMQALRRAFAEGAAVPAAKAESARPAKASPRPVPGAGAVLAAAKPRLYLHIGMGKTGTTLIQQFCWKNRIQLRKAGLKYPTLGVEAGAHHRLSPHVPPFLAKTWQFIDPKDWVPQLASGARVPILVSSELMASADAATVQHLAACLLPAFDVRVIVYVRRIDDSIMSSFNQNVKAGTQRLSIEDALPTLFEKLRIDRLLAKWTEAFGRQAIIVRPYERAQFTGGDILQDLCAILGVPWSEGFVRTAGNPNARLGRSALEFKRCLNVVVPDNAISARFNPALLDFSAQQDGGTQTAFQQSDLLPGSVRRMLIAMQDDIYRDLAGQQPGQQPGQHGTALFTEPLPADDPAWVPLALTPEAFATVGRAVLTEPLLQILRQQIEDARALHLPQRLLYAARFADLV